MLRHGIGIAKHLSMVNYERFKHILAILFTSLSIGCSAELGKNQPTEYDQANHEITVGNYNTAIAIMSERLEASPQDRKARYILASAYAARAGIFLSDYFDVHMRINEKIKQNDEFWANQSKNIFGRLGTNVKNTKQESVLDIFMKLYRVIFEVNQIISIFELLPTISEPSKRDLGRAVYILNEEPGYSGGPALYRGVLRLALLKNNLKTKYRAIGFDDCNVDIQALTAQLTLLKQDVNGVLTDLAGGSQPNNKDSGLYKMSVQIDGSFSKILDALRSYGSTGALDIAIMAAEVGADCNP